MCGDDDDRRRCLTRVQPLQDLHPVHIGQPQVKQHHIKRAIQFVHRLGTGFHRDDLERFVAQILLVGTGEGATVLDKQQPVAAFFSHSDISCLP